MTHTPGPWSRFEGKDEVYIVAPDSSVVAIVSPLVDEGCFWPNAYILHASLDLLKACEQAKTLLDALRIDNDVGELLSETQRHAFRCVDEQLQAAIAKAKGDECCQELERENDCLRKKLRLLSGAVQSWLKEEEKWAAEKRKLYEENERLRGELINADKENDALREELHETRRAPYRKHGYVERMEADGE